MIERHRWGGDEGKEKEGRIEIMGGEGGKRRRIDRQTQRDTEKGGKSNGGGEPPKTNHVLLAGIAG